VRNISPPPGFDPRTVQPLSSRYTDWATRPTSWLMLSSCLVDCTKCWFCVNASFETFHWHYLLDMLQAGTVAVLGRAEDTARVATFDALESTLVQFCCVFFKISSLVIRPLFSFIVYTKQTSQQFRHCTEARMLCPFLLNIRYFEQKFKWLIHVSDNSYNGRQKRCTIS